MLFWLCFTLLTNLFFVWVIFYQGADWLAKLDNLPIVNWLSQEYNAEQIKCYACILWIVWEFLLIYGFLNTAFREQFFDYIWFFG
ncbi:hypothetical protein MOMA_07681 [Moraxella macacae 0408225]|uniref:Uncharacterized protein n=1 Tax=Moraxella macacae 0408225 TaxID=1230338 RepID=L2F5T3_9GAMM|nr:hypothetical protein [Moraxella macacae]ELA08424.1 hypothetical protein MOMA_07681 [Moraxella macacae 0408225]